MLRTPSSISLHLANKSGERGVKSPSVFSLTRGQALVDLKGTSRQPPLSLPCLGETGVEVEDQPSAAVACRQLCLALPVFSCTLYESPSPEKILILRALSLSLLSLHQNKFCKGSNLASSPFKENSELCTSWALASHIYPSRLWQWLVINIFETSFAFVPTVLLDFRSHLIHFIQQVFMEHFHPLWNTKQILSFSSVQFSCSVVSYSLRPHELQHTRPPCPSPTPRVYSNSCPSSWWCHPAISSSVVPFSSCPQSVPASGSFPMSQLFA